MLWIFFSFSISQFLSVFYKASENESNIILGILVCFLTKSRQFASHSLSQFTLLNFKRIPNTMLRSQFPKVIPACSIINSVRSIHCTRTSFGYKKWSDLSKNDKQKFITSYVNLYKEKHPCSKSNVMYRSLANDMDVYDDSPYVFGILYNEIRAVTLGESTDNKQGEGGPMSDPDFAKLLSK